MSQCKIRNCLWDKDFQRILYICNFKESLPGSPGAAHTNPPHEVTPTCIVFPESVTVMGPKIYVSLWMLLNIYKNFY